MGSGSWTTQAFCDYTIETKGVRSVLDFTSDTSRSAQSVFKNYSIDKTLDPRNVMRECVDTDEHPETLPVILALDVTGSMGTTSTRVAQKLNDIMTDLYSDNSIKDIEFCAMAIGDLSYDNAPIQISQFESDIRIAEQVDKVYFEGGGGGNTFESYTAAWYMGLNHCKLDCWNRGKKGVIITLGDELPNPYLPKDALERVTGDKLQADIETKDLIEEVKEKYDIYHISVKEKTCYQYYLSRGIDDKWRELLGDNYYVCGLDDLPMIITEIIKKSVDSNSFLDTYCPGINPDAVEIGW